MFTLISFILTAVFIIACTSSLRRNPVPYYIGAAVISAAVFVIQLTGASRAFPAFVTDYIWALFFRGGIAGAFFATVMWTGAVPVSSKRMKQNMPIRGELSILAGILALGHGAANGLTYFRMLITAPERMSVTTLLFVICSIVLVLVMLPLFITSFKTVRRKMKASSWKKLQRLAYVFYALTFAHVSLLYIPGLIQGRDYWLSYIIYCFVFVSYAICRVFKAILKRANVKMLKVQIVGNVLAVLITALVIGLVYISSAATAYRTSAEKELKSAQESVKAAETAVQQAESEAAEQAKTIEELQAAIEESGADSAGQSGGNSDTAQVSSDNSQTVSDADSGNSDAAGSETAASGQKYNDGTYYGTGDGYEGQITVSVTIENDLITWIEVTDSIEDPEFMEPALAVIPDVINSQNTDLDAVSGSTYSSYGILDAVDAALAQARK